MVRINRNKLSFLAVTLLLLTAAVGLSQEPQNNKQSNGPALRFYSDPSQLDLVLLSGCGNDVGVQNLLNASNVGEVDEMIQAKCGMPMENLLRRIIRTFPSAQVIVTGYYPFFSEQTRNDFVLKGLARRFFKTQSEGDVRMSSKEVFERLKLNSKQWYDTSNTQIAEAVRKVNADTGQERIAFARIDFPAAYSFAASRGTSESKGLAALCGFNYKHPQVE